MSSSRLGVTGRVATADVQTATVRPTAWIAPGAVVVGDVTIGDRASIWYAVVIRADQESIRVGDKSNVQDGSVLHADPGFPLTLGERVSVGHGAVLHGCS